MHAAALGMVATWWRMASGRSRTRLKRLEFGDLI
jgi:hypothetical protein